MKSYAVKPHWYSIEASLNVIIGFPDVAYY